MTHEEILTLCRAGFTAAEIKEMYKPVPAPVPETAPAPVPETVPAPVPETVPAPVPETVPAPVPETAPAPDSGNAAVLSAIQELTRTIRASNLASAAQPPVANTSAEDVLFNALHM